MLPGSDDVGVGTDLTAVGGVDRVPAAGDVVIGGAWGQVALGDRPQAVARMDRHDARGPWMPGRRPSWRHCALGQGQAAQDTEAVLVTMAGSPVVGVRRCDHARRECHTAGGEHDAAEAGR